MCTSKFLLMFYVFGLPSNLKRRVFWWSCIFWTQESLRSTRKTNEQRRLRDRMLNLAVVSDHDCLGQSAFPPYLVKVLDFKVEFQLKPQVWDEMLSLIEYDWFCWDLPRGGMKMVPSAQRTGSWSALDKEEMRWRSFANRQGFFFPSLWRKMHSPKRVRSCLEGKSEGLGDHSLGIWHKQDRLLNTSNYVLLGPLLVQDSIFHWGTWLLHGCWETNSVLHTCVANTLLTELFQQLHSTFLNIITAFLVLLSDCFLWKVCHSFLLRPQRESVHSVVL